MDVPNHLIDLFNDEVKPFYSAQYRAGPIARHFAASEINRMIAENVIELVPKKWAAKILFARRRERSLCLCVDYRKLNAVRIRGTYLLAFVDKSIDGMEWAAVLSTLHANSGYSQIEINDHNW